MTDPPFDAFRYAHAHRTEIVWMSQNTNHLVPPEVVQEPLFAAIRERRYEGYPFGSGDPELRDLVLADLGFERDAGILIAAGGTEALYMLTRALLAPGDEVIASDPSYLIIHKFIELSGARTRNLEIYQEPYRLTPDRVQAAITDKTRMILLIDPLNPLGSGYPAEDVRAIAELAHDHHLILLNDVTYRDFAPAPTLAAKFAPEETLTVWSVSKNCGLAGLRLGGLAGRPELVKKVAKFNTNDLGVNILAQVAAMAALRTKSRWIDSVRTTTRANQARIREAVADVPGTFLPVYPSHASMFVIDVTGAKIAPEALQQELLLRHGVFIRAGNYLSPQFGQRFVRVSFSNSPEDIDCFVGAFAPAVAALTAGATPIAAPAAHP
ncbi:MAG: pyridoxal phosphate-dependent aminotransferase [Thermoplasmata archaeon]|nr:pyridoxal phosphate-dependent aminotransferase [Thermoplasmata archaeon]